FVYTLVKTKVNESHSKMKKSIEGLIEEAGYVVAKTEIRQSELFKQATNVHRPVMFFARNERPYRDYKAFTQELLEQIKETEIGKK
ncbi:ParA family protein, partial [Salmonella enterica]